MARCEKCDTRSCDYAQIMTLATAYYEKNFRWDKKLNVCSLCGVWLGTQMIQPMDLSLDPVLNIVVDKALVDLAPCEKVYWKQEMEEDRARWEASQKQKKTPKLKVLPRPSKAQILEMEKKRLAKGGFPCVDEPPKPSPMEGQQPLYVKELVEDMSVLQERLKIKLAAEKKQTEEAILLERERQEREFIKHSFPAQYAPFIWPFDPTTDNAQEALKTDPDYFLKLMRQASCKTWNRLHLEHIFLRVNDPKDVYYKSLFTMVKACSSTRVASDPIPIPQPELQQDNGRSDSWNNKPDTTNLD